MARTARVRTILVALTRKAGLTVRHRTGRADEFPRARDMAYCLCHRTGDVPLIVTAPKLERQSIERIAGVLAHELGHCAAFIAGMPDHREVDADRWGSTLTGLPVRYDREAVETIGRGTRRPEHLPR